MHKGPAHIFGELPSGELECGCCHLRLPVDEAATRLDEECPHHPLKDKHVHDTQRGQRGPGYRDAESP